TLSVFLGYLVGTELVPAPRPASITTGIALGTLCFVISATLLSFIPLTRWSVLPLAAVACFGTTWIVRKLPDTATLRRVTASPGLLAVRAMTSVVTVLTVTGLAHLLGPKWSGLLVGYPVNSLPVMVILHSHYGHDVVKPFIKIFPAGIFGVCLFNLVAWLSLERLGLASTIVLGYGVDIAYLAPVAGGRGGGRWGGRARSAAGRGVGRGRDRRRGGVLPLASRDRRHRGRAHGGGVRGLGEVGRLHRPRLVRQLRARPPRPRELRAPRAARPGDRRRLRLPPHGHF